MLKGILLVLILNSLTSVLYSQNCSVVTCEMTCKPNNYPTMECIYVECCCEDEVGEARINYLSWIYCDMYNNRALALIILCVALLYAFILLAMIADQYFAPLMEQLTMYFNLSHNVAGVTFLAWANGAPDVAASVAAISSGGDQIRLGIGALLGATVFDTQFICATIACVCSSITVARRPLIRDCIYLSAAASIVLWICWNGSVSFYMSIGIILFYGLYVIFVYVTSKLRKWYRKKHGLPISSNIPIVQPPKKRTFSDVMIESRAQRKKYFREIISKYRIIKIFVMLFMLPNLLAKVLFKLTVTLPDEKHWNGYLSALHCITAPIVIIVSFDLFKYDRLWLIPFLLGVAMSIVTLVVVRYKSEASKIPELLPIDCHTEITQNGEYGTGITQHSVTELSSVQNKSALKSSTNDIPIFSSLKMSTNTNNSKEISNVSNDTHFKQEPVLVGFFLLLSFITCIAWIVLIAEELVSILTAIGIYSSVDLTLLGMTVLAYGNQTPDFINNLSVARKGFGSMAISASLGGTAMDVNLGVGIGTLIGSLNSQNVTYQMPNSGNIFIGCLFIVFGCIGWIVVTALNKWKLNKAFAIFGYTHYISFMVINILLYTSVIRIDSMEQNI